MKRQRVASPDLAPPDGLTPAARARWEVVARLLRGPVDRDLLTRYCQVYARWKEAEDGIAKTGQLIKNDRGRPVANPLIAIAKDAGAQVRMLERQLDLQREQPAADNDKLLTRRDLSAELGVHMMTITKWERDGMPIAQVGRRGKPSLYSRSKVEAWRQAREVQARSVDGAALSPQHERALLDRQRRAELELRLKKQRGELVDVAEVTRQFEDVANAVKARLRRIPDGIADRLVKASARGPAVVKAMLKREIDDALRELSLRADSRSEVAAERDAEEALA